MVAYLNVNKDGAEIIDKAAVCLYIMVILNPILRLAGLIYQTHRYNSLIRAGCLEYNFQVSLKVTFLTQM